MGIELLLFLTHLVSTLTMFGVIWTIQLVHYPLFRGVGTDGYAAYQAEHTVRITWIVGPAMLAELGTAVTLVTDLRPDPVPIWMAVSGLVLVGLIWLSTAALQVPMHRRLASGFDAEAHRRLVATNWIRTAAWSVRAALVTWMAWILLS